MIWILLGILIMLPSAHALELRQGDGYYFDLNAALTLWRDPSAIANVDQAAQAAALGRFKSGASLSPTIGFTRDAIWLHLRVANIDHPTTRWLLVMQQARNDEVDIYQKHADGHWIVQASLGDQRPFNQRSSKHRFPNWMAHIAPGDSIEILLRVHSTASLQVPLILATEAEFFKRSHEQQLVMGLYFGLLLSLAIFNLAVMFSIRDSAYAWYVGYVSAFGLMMLAMHGYGAEYLWRDQLIWQNLSLPISVGLTVITGVAFSRDFLNLKQLSPALYNAFAWGMLLIAILVLWACLGRLFEATVALNIGVIVMGLSVIAAGIYCAARGYRPAWFFLAAWASVIGFGIATPLSSFGLLQRNFLTENGLQIGSSLEMLLLSLSLSYRIHVLRNDNIRIAREAKDTLEVRVIERTQELNLANQQLASANERLHEFSRRDGLTGLFNRRHLDQQLQVLWQAHVDGESALCLLMIDLDHFKRINDDYGHAVGDQCLREVATRLDAVCAPSQAFAARYGGEEFVVIVAAKSLFAAHQLAETIEHAIGDQMIVTDRGEIAMSVSIGIAEAKAHRTHGVASWLHAADTALYRAKAEGRHCIRVDPASSPLLN